jgi:hypothetical protein
MDTEYGIEPVGSQYIVVDPWDEIVGRSHSEVTPHWAEVFRQNSKSNEN